MFHSFSEVSFGFLGVLHLAPDAGPILLRLLNRALVVVELLRVLTLLDGHKLVRHCEVNSLIYEHQCLVLFVGLDGAWT